MSDSDDEYGPLATAWGTQVAETFTNSWHTLADPNIKTGANGLGSGQLHRQGKNYVPVSEEDILSYRLNQGTTKKKLGQKELPQNKKSPRKATNKPPVKQAGTTAQPFVSRPPPKNQEKNNWNSSALVEIPFWENSTTETFPSSSSKNSTTASCTLLPDKTITNSISDQKKNKQIVDNMNTNPLPTENNWVGTGATWGQNEKKNAVVNHNSKEGCSTVLETGSWGAVSEKAEGRPDVWGDPPKTESNSWGTVPSTSTLDNWNANKVSKAANWRTKNDHISAWGAAAVAANSRLPTANSRKQMADKEGWGVKPQFHDENPAAQWSNFSEYEVDRTQTPLWLDPDRDLQNTSGKYQFSNPSKKKYSESKPKSSIRPMNYSNNKEVPVPTEVAPEPLPENSVVVTIYVELGKDIKIPVKVRALDDPQQLAKQFAEENNINTESVIQALTNLFESQKAAVMSKRNRKVQRIPQQTYYNKQYAARKSVHNNHTHTPSKNTYNSPPSPQVPFTRSQYY
ncbi:hypothetical protein BY458DRAFT_586892 [Sporodiniella umbellata]|nr:hypothetical protein BY458DRAFT_586892 [Sporodiniella umbellata]